MANGKAHDRFNLIILALLIGALVSFQFRASIIIVTALGFLLSTFIFSPDTDLMPKKRTGVLAFFLYPYSLIHKHRGYSHHLIWGGIGRVIYTIIFLGLIIYVLHGLDYISFSSDDYTQSLLDFIQNFNLNERPYQITAAFFAGTFLADWSHLFLDWLSGLLKKLLRPF